VDTEINVKKSNKTLIIVLITVLVLAAAVCGIIFGVYNGVNVIVKGELGEGDPSASVFLKDGGSGSFADLPEISRTEENHYFLKLKANDRSYRVLYIVRDTKAPEAKDAELRLTIDDTSLEPLDCLKDVYDASEITAEWVTEPELGKAGEYAVSVKLTDSFENTATVGATVKILGAKELVCCEAGGDRPTIEDFMVVEREDASFVTELDSIKWNVPDDYIVEISVDGKTYESILRIEDTTPPAVDLVSSAVEIGGEPKTESFVCGYTDATEVTHELTEVASTEKVGAQTCVITSTDLGGNKTENECRLYVCDKVIEVEASMTEISASELIAKCGDEYKDYTVENGFTPDKLGARIFTAKSGEKSAVIGVKVVDTTAPTAKGVSVECCAGYPCEAERFVTEVSEVSPYTVSYVSGLDWETDGQQSVTVRVTDRAGNSVDVEAAAVLSADKTAPVIHNARDRYCYIGDSVSYFKEVCATDNADPEPELSVDNSKVDSKKAGKYEVTFTAKDHEGNTSSVTVNYTFIEKTVSDEELGSAVKAVTAKIFKDNMTAEEKAYAVFCYCSNNISCTGSSDKTDWKAAAAMGLTEGTGDAFTVYAASYALLQQIDGIKVMSVERYKSSSQHFWCLVDLGTGWYNFDACSNAPDGFRCFMRSCSVLDGISAQYWRLDPSIAELVETSAYAIRSMDITE